VSSDRIREIVERPWFTHAITALIVANAVTLGLETSPAVVSSIGALLHWFDRIALTIFVVELAMRLYAYRERFFRDPWSLFDLTVVAIALVPSTGPFAVVRALRVLRALRLVSRVPSMRRVISGLLVALPGMLSTGALLGLVLYIAAVMATGLFGSVAPEHFGSLGTTLFTLFQVMTGEAWPDIADKVMAELPWAWIFFVVYILVSSFAVLNLFIAVVVNGMESEIAAEQRAEAAKDWAAEKERDRLMLEELRALRAEIAALRQRDSSDGEVRTPNSTA
jgi:voltage-gated sodium channel